MATVNANGVVTAVSVGAATISVSSEGISGSIGINVTGPGPIASITLSAAKTSLMTGDDVQITAVVGINAHGDCRYYVGEAEYLGWEVRKQALDQLFFDHVEE